MFKAAAALAFAMVPSEMREDFGVANVPSGGTGVAKYSNYRRFQTSARIVPPPP